MLRLLDAVVGELAARGIPCALIGAGAMAAHGDRDAREPLGRAVARGPFPSRSHEG